MEKHLCHSSFMRPLNILIELLKFACIIVGERLTTCPVWGYSWNDPLRTRGAGVAPKSHDVGSSLDRTKAWALMNGKASTLFLKTCAD